MVNDWPEQIAPLFTVRIGAAFTDTLTTALLVQVPVTPYTVYVVFAVGDNVTVSESTPVVHEYVVAPPAVKVAVFPWQMVVTPVTDTVTVLITLTVGTAGVADTQPFASVPVMEYDVVVVGKTICPLEYVYVTAPLGKKV